MGTSCDDCDAMCSTVFTHTIYTTVHMGDGSRAQVANVITFANTSNLLMHMNVVGIKIHVNTV